MQPQQTISNRHSYHSPRGNRQQATGNKTTPQAQMTAQHPPEAPPPIGKTWRRLYAAVLGFLALLVILFYAFTRAFA